MDEAPATIAPGEILGERYRIVELIGEGAMGSVYRVEHTEMGTPMALKLLKPELLMMPGIEERFNREARSAATLDDPHITRVTDFGRTPSGGLFMVMELLDGQPLGAAAFQDMSQHELIDLISQVLQALETAHAQGVIHRDLKPDNVMIVDRRGKHVVKILDFGLAKLTDTPAGESKLTQAGTVFGTPRYMSPEQATGEPVDGRADLYAVGVILWELLTRRILFDGNTITEILTKHITVPPPSLGIELEDGIDGDALEAVVQKALTKTPEERFKDASEFRAALLAAAGLRPSIAPPRSTSQGRDAPSGTAYAATVVRADDKVAREVSSVAAIPAQTSTRRVLIGLGAVLLVGGGAAAAFMGGVTEPSRLEKLETAMKIGELDKAAKMASVWISEEPKSVEPRLYEGHILYAQGKPAEAAEAYGKAMALDGYAALDERLQNHVREMVDKKSAGLGAMTIHLAEKADVGAAPLLVLIAEKSHTFNMRRKAYEGLERMGEEDELSPFEYLRRELDKNRTDKCMARKWYVERLVKVDDDRALDVYKKELHRKGGFLNLERTSDCMSDMLKKAIDDIEN